VEERLMPGTNAGTGYPLTFRCAKCKVGRNWRSFFRFDTERGRNYRLTGRTRSAKRIGRLTGRTRSAKRIGYRQADIKMEYECLDCGHIGWTQHIDAWYKLKLVENLKEEAK
jgi:hypothetical protein